MYFEIWEVIMSLLNVVLKAAIVQINIFQGGFRQFQYVRWILPGQEIVCPLHLSTEFWKGIPWRTLADMPAQQVLTVHCLSVLPRQS